MPDSESRETVKVRAYSPGRYPILVVELPSDELRTAYYETGYDLNRSKPVTEDWLRDNAIGRHSFIEVDPAADIAVTDLSSYARREILGEA